MAVVAVACLMPAQNDTWWHLRAGQEIVNLRSVALHDTFSHTQSGQYWPDHEWLAQVILYLLYSVGGMPLVTLIAAAAVTGAWFIAWHLTPGTTWRRLGLSSVALPLFVVQWALRPQVFTLLLLAVTVLLIVKDKDQWLPLVFVLWANLHGAVLLGVAIVLAATIARLVEARRFLVKPMCIAAGCVLATAATPLGFSLWAFVAASLPRYNAYQLSEFRPTILVADRLLLPYWVLLISFVILLIIERPWSRSKSTSLLALSCATLALVPLSLASFRNVSPFALLAIPAIGGLLESRFPSRSTRPREVRPLLHGMTLSAAIVVVAIAVAYAWRSDTSRLQWRPMSERAINAVATCPERLYNRFDDGGYLIWFVPQRKVFIDSREAPYPPELMMEHIRVERSGDYEETFRHYSIGCAFLPADSMLAGRLTAARWRQTYADQKWVVLQKDNHTPPTTMAITAAATVMD